MDDIGEVGTPSDEHLRWSHTILLNGPDRTFRIGYRNVDGKDRIWEGVERKTRAAGSSVDAVHIVAVLKKETGPELLLQRQFRPAVGKLCIELPAGLLDKGETVEQCAIRELAEETGYVGTIKSDSYGNSPKLFGGK